MRAFAVLVSLGLIAPALALPTLFSKDPLSIHKRAAIPDSIQIVRSVTATPPPPPAAAVALEPAKPVEADDDEADDACSDICGIQRVQGARDEREALCSAQGLRATLECAQCIDSAWPETTWEDSALAEYERIVQACEDAPQVTFPHPHQSL